MDEFGMFAITLIIALAVTGGFIIHLYPFDFTWEGQFSTSLMTEYDYIIVGGGTAGSVLASRLTENSHVSVLLLEAGGLHNWMSQVPLLSPLLQGSKLDWQFITEPQTQSSFGLTGRASKWPRGRGLGGSTLINYMVHLRGSPSDYEHWQSETGCAEWSPNELRKYFVMSESIEPHPSSESASYEYGDGRGFSGPLHVRRNTEGCRRSEVCTAFLNSMEDSGFIVGDLNGNVEYGAMPSESNVFEGKRFSVYNGYLKPFMNRSNLHVMLRTVVQRVLFDEQSRATGVQIFRHNKLITFRARREVIISAGSINTPLLLTVSGVGSQTELEEHEILPVVPYLPVGENLRDHLSLPIYVHVANVTVGGLSKHNLFELSTVLNFMLYQDGPLVKTGVAAAARIPVPYCLKSSNDVDDTKIACHRSGLLAFLLDVASLDPNIYTRISNLQLSTFSQMFLPDLSIDRHDHTDGNGFVLLIMGTHPKSKGYVKLDANWTPLINPNYLEAEEDVQVLSHGIRFVASLMDTQSMKSVGARLHVPVLDECDAYEPNLDDDQFLECWIRTTAVTAYHPVGTCRMGTDNNSVVDCNLKVKGVQNLRVVDASVMPSLVSASPAATVVAMAERAAILITNDYNGV